MRASFLLFIAVLLGSAATFDDLRRRAIANWINVAGMVAGVAYHMARRGLAGLAWSVGGAAVGFGVFLIFYCWGGLGAGDLKLAAAFGALLGPSGILLATLLTAPIGAAMAAACLIWSWRTRAIPYAPAISLGAWLALLGRG
jgi:prepilin peptidase CpaA